MANGQPAVIVRRLCVAVALAIACSAGTGGLFPLVTIAAPPGPEAKAGARTDR